jgi:SAM-dependent methyltransferase
MTSHISEKTESTLLGKKNYIRQDLAVGERAEHAACQCRNRKAEGTMTRPTGNPAIIRWQHYTGIFLLSLAVLLLELALTRVLSVANWYHFGFLVVSTALLGFGAAGVTLSLWTRLRDEVSMERTLVSLALLFGLVTLASFWLMQRIPFQPFRLLIDHWQFAYMLLYYLIMAAPFFCAGLAISLLLSRGGRAVNLLYAADLMGAGVGCATVCLVIPAFGGSGTIVIAAMSGVLAALAFGSFRLSKLTVFAGVAAVGMLALASVAERAMPVRVTPEKVHPLLPARQKPIYTEWNSFSKVDVYNAPALDPAQPDPGFFSIIIDAGAAGTGMDDLSMGVRNYLAHASDYHPAGVAYVGKEHPKVLVIGSGAGREVLEGLYYGASSITAVEINPTISDIVTKRMPEHWGGLFEQPEVRLVTEDGRSFVRRSEEKYDAIIAVNTFSETALTSGALTLSESFILTREAFEDYWRHLTPNGVLLITGYNPAKLLATTREMFNRLGLGSPADHLFAFRGLVAPFGRMHLSAGFLLQKSPLDTAEVNLMAQRVGIGSRRNWGAEGQPEIYYSPFEKPQSEYQIFLADLVKNPDLERIYASSTAYIRPATDDRPFFNQTKRWGLRLGFRDILGAGAKGSVISQPVAQVTLVVLLIQALVVAGVMILIPLLRFNSKGLRAEGCWAFLTYFAGLGLGFILIEIVLLQRLQLFLGQPIYTFSVVLASLLIFTGLGSYLADRIRSVSYYTLCYAVLAVVAGILFTSVLTPTTLSLALPLELPWRVIIAIAVVAPLGVLLGIPFSTGLRLVGEVAPPLVPWAWAVNGFFTVIGSVAAMILGMVWGFNAVLIIAAACYGIALVPILVRAARPRVVRRTSLNAAATNECRVA